MMIDDGTFARREKNFIKNHDLHKVLELLIVLLCLVLMFAHSFNVLETIIIMRQQSDGGERIFSIQRCRPSC